MSPNEFKKTAAPLTNEDLVEAEEKIGRPLPVDVRNHYLKNNGGVPLRRYIANAETEMRVRRFMPIKHRSFEREALLEEYVVSHRQRSLVPGRFLPFAVDDGGDPFCLDLETGAVVFYALDHSFDSPVTVLASSFTTFLSKMTEHSRDG